MQNHLEISSKTQFWITIFLHNPFSSKIVVFDVQTTFFLKGNPSRESLQGIPPGNPSKKTYIFNYFYEKYCFEAYLFLSLEALSLWTAPDRIDFGTWLILLRMGQNPDCSLRQGAGGTEFARFASRTCFLRWFYRRYQAYFGQNFEEHCSSIKSIVLRSKTTIFEKHVSRKR